MFFFALHSFISADLNKRNAESSVTYMANCVGWERGDRRFGLTNLPLSCADYLQILDPGTLTAFPGLYRDCFTFTFTLFNLYYFKW